MTELLYWIIDKIVQVYLINWPVSVRANTLTVTIQYLGDVLYFWWEKEILKYHTAVCKSVEVKQTRSNGIINNIRQQCGKTPFLLLLYC